MLIRALFSFFIPGGLLIALTIFLVQMNILDPWLQSIAQLYPYFVLGIGFLLGWRFNRSRLAFAVLVLVLADRAVLYFVTGGIVPEESGVIIYNSVAFLVPINIAAISIMKERGLFTIRGRYRLSMIFLQALLIALITYYRPLEVHQYFEYQIFQAAFLTDSFLPQPALFLFLLAFIVLIFSFNRTHGAIESGFFWALLAAFFALSRDELGSHSTLYFAMAGAILVISVVETSYGMAYRDTLTGLQARRALNESLLKLSDQYTLAMLDIDHFKKFNDTYGHDVGDQVLQMVAARLSRVSGGGKAFRYGGEEFTLIFPSKTVDDALPHLEKLRKNIADSGFIIRDPKRPKRPPKNKKSTRKSNKEVRITISAGLAEPEDVSDTPREVIQAADKALYKAKRAGRNCVKT